MKLCDRCSVPGCCLDYLEGACEAARKEYCPDVEPSRFEKIQALELDELAHYIVDMIVDLCEDGLPSLGYVIDWLKQPAEVE